MSRRCLPFDSSPQAPLGEDVVVGNEQSVHTSLQPGIGEVLVQPTSVRKAGVHVYGGDQFLHTVIITPESS